MFAVLALIVCCAVIPLIVGVGALLGLSRKDKRPVNQKAAIAQEDKN